MFEQGVQVGQVREVAHQLRALCAQLDPNTIGLLDVPEVFDLFCGMHKAVGGAVTRLTPRYRTATQGKPGVADPLDEVARKTGTTKTAARRRAAAGEAAATSPTLDDAVRSGALSPDQTDAIVGAGDEASEDDVGELVETAKEGTVKELREAAARTRARQAGADARRRRVHANRRLARWTADDGTWHLHFNGLPAWGAEINAVLQPILDDVFAQARRAGRRDDMGTYAADAFYQLLTGRTTNPDTSQPTDTDDPADGADQAADENADQASDQASDQAPVGDTRAPVRRRSNLAVRPDRKVIATVPLQALRRGHLDHGETCEIAGVGPVAVATAREILGDGFLTLVITDGIDIHNVTHLGRQVTAHQRTALEARGYRCANPHCDATANLQIDHVDDWALTHQTVLDDLDWLCHTDHDRKTNHGWTLTGPVGNRRFHPPNPDPRAPDPPSRHTRSHPPPRDPTEPRAPTSTFQQQTFTTAT